MSNMIVSNQFLRNSNNNALILEGEHQEEEQE